LAAINTRSNTTRKISVVVLMCLTCLGIDLYSQGVTPLTMLSDPTTRFLHAYNLASYLTIMAALAFVYAQGVGEAEQRLHKHATTDSLTGLRNRRRLLELAHDELARASRSGTPVSIIIADIDHFKSINDRYGHPVGDRVMVSMARCLRDCVRRQDHVARWGGEEFIIVLPDIDLQGAYQAAERMRKQIEQLYVVTELETVRCTASFGVSEWSIQRNENFEQCLGRADAALYAAKQFGRNRTCLSEPPVLSEHLVAEVLRMTDPAQPQQTGTHTAAQTTQAMPSHRNAG
jgi:diguanylate cyclase (GGDEF)-like protein